MTWLTELNELLNNPNMRHAAIVHLPIALAVIGLVFAMINAILRGRNTTLHWTTFFLFIALLVMGWIGKSSGADAEAALPGSLSAAARELIEDHEELGEWIWIAAAINAGLLVIAAVEKPAVKLISAVGGLIGGLVTMGIVANTAHFGGSAVYLHGAGTKQPPVSAGASAGAAGAVDPRAEFFINTVYPILEANCFTCHNAAKARGGLDQTSIASLLRGGNDEQYQPVIAPGDPEGSWLIRAVRYTDEDLAMPPKEENRLSDEQIAALERWIKEGAVWGAR